MDERYNLKDVKVGEVMSTDPTVVSEESTLEELVGKFKREGYHAFPVCSREKCKKLKGVVCKSDLVESMGRKKMSDFFVTHVKDIMTTPTTISPDAHISDALDMMMKRGIRFIPVVDEEEKVVGVLSYSDIATQIVKRER